jgi:hypothetical protein
MPPKPQDPMAGWFAHVVSCLAVNGFFLIDGGRVIWPVALAEERFDDGGLQDRAARLRGETDAAAEVEDHLARARRAQAVR